MNRYNHEEIHDLLGAYALDALEPDETKVVDSHLEDCRGCADEASDYRDLAGLLGNCGVDAPAHLWDRIASQIERPIEADNPRPLAVLFADVPESTGRVHRNSAVSGSRRKSLRILATAAALIAIVSLSVQVVRLEGRSSRPSSVSMSTSLRAALTDPNARVATLTQDVVTSHPVLAKIVVLPSGSAYLINEHLGSLSPSKTYQLWGRTGDRIVSLGLLGDHPDVVSFEVSPNAGVSIFAITVEQAGGVVTSTHKPVAEGAIS